jgi:hypothetical protein
MLPPWVMQMSVFPPFPGDSKATQLSPTPSFIAHNIFHARKIQGYWKIFTLFLVAMDFIEFAEGGGGQYSI